MRILRLVAGPPRKRTALDWIAVAVEENGREIVEVYLEAVRKGDWRAAEALMNRIYGKPERRSLPTWRRLLPSSSSAR